MIHGECPTSTNMQKHFGVRRPHDIWYRQQYLLKLGYLKKDPTFRPGMYRSAYRLGKKFDCTMLHDPKRLKEFEDRTWSTFKKKNPANMPYQF